MPGMENMVVGKLYIQLPRKKQNKKLKHTKIFQETKLRVSGVKERVKIKTKGIRKPFTKSWQIIFLNLGK